MTEKPPLSMSMFANRADYEKAVAMTADTQAQGDLMALAEKCGAYISTFQFDDSRVRGVSLTADQLQAFAAALQGRAQEGEPSEWRPIETAPSDVLVVVGWRDESDPENPDRHMFDYLEEGVWQNYFNEHEHYAIAGAAHGNSEDAPYTHWTPMRAIPQAGERTC